jgi:hypothetical protein
MWSMPVVLMYPWHQVCVPMLGVLVEPCVGPFSDSGLDESFGFSVCARGIDAGADVSSIEGMALSFEAVGDKAGPVIGHDAAYSDVESREVSRRLTKEKAGGNRLFIRHHGYIGHAGVIVDSDVEELPAGAASLVLGIACDAMARLVDACQLLDVDVQQVSGAVSFVAVGRQLGFQHANFIHPEPGEDATDGGPAQAGELGDLNAGLALSPQLFDALGRCRRSPTRRPMRARTKVGQASGAQSTITAHPFGSTLPAEPALGWPSTTLFASCSRL